MRAPLRFTLVLISVLIAACAEATSPRQSELKPGVPQLDVVDSTMCRSGYNVSQGRCN